jgi:hypothetical protein
MTPTRIAVYTCITGGYDELTPVLVATPGVEYICFSDVPVSAPAPWQVRVLSLPGLNAKDKNRYVKMHPAHVLPDHDVTVYIDGSIQVVGNLEPLLQTVLASTETMFLYEHYLRRCIYEEAEACAHGAVEWIWRIAAQMRKYRKEGFPANRGLFEAGVLICKKDPAAIALMEQWWREYRAGAKRDQLSLTPVAWREGFHLGSLGQSDARFEHRYFKYRLRPTRGRLLRFLRLCVNRGIAAAFSYEWLFGIEHEIGRNAP